MDVTVLYAYMPLDWVLQRLVLHVVSRDSIHIGLNHVALLGLPVIGADIHNAYLQTPSLENHFIFVALRLGSKMKDVRH